MYSRYPISDLALTCPSKVRGLRATNVTSSSCFLTWLDPESGHACLKAYSIKVETHDNKIFKASSSSTLAQMFGTLFEIGALLLIKIHVFLNDASTKELFQAVSKSSIPRLKIIRCVSWCITYKNESLIMFHD